MSPTVLAVSGGEVDAPRIETTVKHFIHGRRGRQYTYTALWLLLLLAAHPGIVLPLGHLSKYQTSLFPPE